MMNEAGPSADRMFGGVESAEARRERVALKPGTYHARIVRCRMATSRRNEDFLAIDMVVVGIPFNRGDQTPVGSEFSRIFMNSGAQADYFLPEVKAAIMAITGQPEDAVTLQVCKEMVSNDQPLSGVVIEVEVSERVGKKLDENGQPKVYNNVRFCRALNPDERGDAALLEQYAGGI